MSVCSGILVLMNGHTGHKLFVDALAEAFDVRCVDQKFTAGIFSYFFE